MSQPTMTVLTINPQQAAWDATVNTQFQTLREWLEDNPLPIKDEAGSLPTASSWDQSLIFHESSGTWFLKYSDGAAWQTVAISGDFVATLGQTISDPPTQAEVQTLSDKVDEIIVALKAGYALPAS